MESKPPSLLLYLFFSSFKFLFFAYSYGFLTSSWISVFDSFAVCLLNYSILLLCSRTIASVPQCLDRWRLHHWLGFYWLVQTHKVNEELQNQVCMFRILLASSVAPLMPFKVMSLGLLTLNKDFIFCKPALHWQEAWKIWGYPEIDYHMETDC